MVSNVTQATLKSLLEAFNRHDLDAIMAYFADDCVLYLPRGASGARRALRGQGRSTQRVGDTLCGATGCTLCG